MSQAAVSDHIASLERFLGQLQSLDISALSAALFPSPSASSVASAASACCSSSSTSVGGGASASDSASTASMGLAGSMESGLKHTLVSAYYKSLTARKYCQDIMGITHRSDHASLRRLQAISGFVDETIVELGNLMDRVFEVRRIPDMSSSSTALSAEELARITPEQQQAFQSQLRHLPGFVGNLLREHQGAGVPITVTLKENNQMRFVDPVSIKNTLYGRIIRAKETATEELCAIKLSGWESYLQRNLAENFMREARMNQLLQPVPDSIVAVKEVGCDREHHWTVMEYVQGSDLFDRIVSPQGVTEAEAWLWMHQGLEALSHCHSRKVTHADVSAENFMVSADGRLKLCDMGQARVFSTQRLPSGVEVELPFPAGTAYGTKLYCQPPEMLLRLPVFGTKLDVFSMGVVGYTAVQGCRPFQHGAWLHDAEYARCSQGVGAEIARNARMQCLANQARPDPRCHLNPQCTYCGSAEAVQSGSSCRISAGMADVLARMLCLPEQRASIHELLQMPWMLRLPGSDEGVDEGAVTEADFAAIVDAVVGASTDDDDSSSSSSSSSSSALQVVDPKAEAVQVHNPSAAVVVVVHQQQQQQPVVVQDSKHEAAVVTDAPARVVYVDSDEDDMQM